MTRILVIDNDNDIADSLRLSLQPEMYDVLVALSYEEALECARTAKPHVILLDLASDSNGSQHICKKIREISQAPILVLSVLNTPGLMAHLLNEGADDCLVKPALNSVLIARLNMLARRARAEIEAGEGPQAAPPPNGADKEGYLEKGNDCGCKI